MRGARGWQAHLAQVSATIKKKHAGPADDDAELAEVHARRSPRRLSSTAGAHARPGATLLAFGGTRTHHRLMCAIEDAGWEIRDCMMWLYGSGFPKALDLGKAIDKQDAVLTSGYNVPLVFVAETDPTEGTTAAKHITKQVTLQEPGVGLKILLSANRPSEADFEVYYKTGTGDDVLDDKSWILVNKESVLPADNDRTTYREYEYLAGGTGGTLPPFTTYQVKIVMTSTNSSRIRKIRDLRIIALAT